MRNVVMILIIIVLQLIGCNGKDNKTTPLKNMEPAEDEKVLITDIYTSIEGEDMRIRWGDGTLFIVEDEKIIRKFLNIISNVEYTTHTENKDGYLYFIKYGDISLNSNGVFKDSYLLNDSKLFNKIEVLLHDYLPSYSEGYLEFQSDLMPDSHLYIVVKVEKAENGILYFSDHKDNYSFELGSTEIDETFEYGDVVEIETNGRIPSGDTINIKTYSISKIE